MSDGGAQLKTFGPFFNSNGDIYRGNQVNIYEAGTTTNKTYWTDEDKSTEGAHSAIDSNNDGIFEAYFDGDYRIQIRDSSGTTLDDPLDWDSYKITSDTAGIWEGNQGLAYPSASADNKGQLFVPAFDLQ